MSTDNAWLELTIIKYQDESKEDTIFDDLQLKSSENENTFKWIDLSYLLEKVKSPDKEVEKVLKMLFNEPR